MNSLRPLWKMKYSQTFPKNRLRINSLATFTIFRKSWTVLFAKNVACMVNFKFTESAKYYFYISSSLKILFGSNENSNNFILKIKKVISLINTLVKILKTIKIDGRFDERKSKTYQGKYTALTCLAFFLSIFFLIMRKLYKTFPAKIQKMFRHLKGNKSSMEGGIRSKVREKGKKKS